MIAKGPLEFIRFLQQCNEYRLTGELKNRLFIATESAAVIQRMMMLRLLGENAVGKKKLLDMVEIYLGKDRIVTFGATTGNTLKRRIRKGLVTKGKMFILSEERGEQDKELGVKYQFEIAYSDNVMEFDYNEPDGKGGWEPVNVKLEGPLGFATTSTDVEASGHAIHSIWTDIPPINSQAKERLGFPTQKPVQLLERVISSCSNEGDWILDPFCGCGTAVIAAEKLRRHWIGVDITYLAINLVKGRLRDSFPGAKFEVEGEPRDLGAAIELAKNRYQFQWWALSLIGARPTGSTEAKPREGKKGPDEAVDGWLRFPTADHFERIVVSVKSGHVGVKDIRELRDTVSRQRAAMGIFITLEEPTSEMIKEVKVTEPYISPVWHHEYPKLQILTVEELLKGKRPSMPQVENSFKRAPTEERATRSTSAKLFQNDKRHGAPTLSP